MRKMCEEDVILFSLIKALRLFRTSGLVKVVVSTFHRKKPRLFVKSGLKSGVSTFHVRKMCKEDVILFSLPAREKSPVGGLSGASDHPPVHSWPMEGAPRGGEGLFGISWMAPTLTLGLATNGRRPAGPQPTSYGTPCSFVAYSMGLRARGAMCSEPCLSLTSNPPPALAVALAAACSRPCSRPCSHPRSRPCSRPRSRPCSRPRSALAATLAAALQPLRSRHCSRPRSRRRPPCRRPLHSCPCLQPHAAAAAAAAAANVAAAAAAAAATAAVAAGAAAAAAAAEQPPQQPQLSQLLETPILGFKVCKMPLLAVSNNA